MNNSHSDEFSVALFSQVIGMPSKDLMEEMGDAEKKRLASQVEKLGQDGLAEKHQELDQAVEENEVR